jgi:small multidrug resistance pump
MFAQSPIMGVIGLIMLSATGYAVATAGMKLASGGVTFVAVSLMAFGLVGAVIGEIILLRHSELGVIYMCILATESLLILGLAIFWGENFTEMQIFGAVLVLSGLFLVTR